MTSIVDKANGQLIWTQRKRNWCRTPFTFTTYVLTDEEVDTQTGLLNRRFDVTKLYQVTDVSVTANILQSIFGLSTVVVSAVNQAGGNDDMTLKNVTGGYEVRKQLQAAVDAAKQRHRGVAHEIVGGEDGYWTADGGEM